MNDISKSALKRIKSIGSIVLIGAIGSGLWDIFLKDLLFNVANLFVRFTSSIFSGYVDNLYSNVGSGGNTLVILPALIFIILSILSPIIIYWVFSYLFQRMDVIDKTLEHEGNSLFDRFASYIIGNRIKGMGVLLLPAVLISGVYVHILISEISQILAVQCIERNLEIVRPYTTEDEFNKLWSDYRLIDGKVKLETLLDRTYEIAINNQIDLPEIQLLGIAPPGSHGRDR